MSAIGRALRSRACRACRGTRVSKCFVSSRATLASRSAPNRAQVLQASRAADAAPRRTRACAFRVASACERLAPRRGFRRQETFEREALGRQSRDRERRDCRAGPGTRNDCDCLRATAAATSSAPGSLSSGVPASVTSATSSPRSSRATICRRPLAFVVFVQRLERAAARAMPQASSSVRVCRVSSASSRSASRRHAVARGLRSCRLPIGVATTNSVPARGATRRIATLFAHARLPGSPMLHVPLRTLERAPRSLAALLCADARCRCGQCIFAGFRGRRWSRSARA